MFYVGSNPTSRTISRNTNRRASPLEAFGDFQLLATASRAEADVPSSLTQPRDLTPSACMRQGRRVPKRLKVRTAIFSDQSAGCRFESGAPLHRQEALAQSVRAVDTHGGQSAWTLFLLKCGEVGVTQRSDTPSLRGFESHHFNQLKGKQYGNVE